MVIQIILSWCLMCTVTGERPITVRHALNSEAIPCRDCLTEITGAQFSEEQATEAARPPFDLAGVRVWVDGRPQRVRSVTPDQVIFVLDAPKGFRWLIVRTQADQFLTVQFAVVDDWPGVTIAGDKDSIENFIPLGLWTPDKGSTIYPITTAPIPVGPLDRPTLVLLRGTGWRHVRYPYVRLNGISCRLVGAFPAPGFPGEDEIVFELPHYLADNGGMDVVITIGTRSSNYARIYLGP